MFWLSINPRVFLRWNVQNGLQRVNAILHCPNLLRKGNCMHISLTTRHACSLLAVMACLTLSACSNLQEWTSSLNLPTTSTNSSVSPVVELLNGNDLNAWKPLGNANWRLQDRVVQAELGDGFLVTRASYQNFHLVAEFWVDDEANSGIFFRCADANLINDKNAYEANIYDKRPDPAYGTGAVVNIAKSLVQPNIKAGGHWNTYDITVINNHIQLVLNGQTTVDVKDDTHTAAGPIALQYNKGVVKFRKLSIQTL
ncbi:MAG: DUF1080 domain-containing protein [Betaproteobacteria bacterium]|nr:DUF1080 domain-containing protein [Betaproteobacteria bacterium]